MAADRLRAKANGRLTPATLTVNRPGEYRNNNYADKSSSGQ